MKIALLTAGSRVSPVFETTLSWLAINASEDGFVIDDTYAFDTRSELDMVYSGASDTSAVRVTFIIDPEDILRAIFTPGKKTKKSPTLYDV